MIQFNSMFFGIKLHKAFEGNTNFAKNYCGIALINIIAIKDLQILLNRLTKLSVFKREILSRTVSLH
jgi:hypothetical protein